jgi:hypothetical protein
MPEPGKKRKSNARTKKPSRGKSAPKRRKQSAKLPKAISSDVRRQMIAEAAYFKAANRDFLGGDPERDWCEAEAEIDAILLDSEPPKV